MKLNLSEDLITLLEKEEVKKINLLEADNFATTTIDASGTASDLATALQNATTEEETNNQTQNTPQNTTANTSADTWRPENWKTMNWGERFTWARTEAPDEESQTIATEIWDEYFSDPAVWVDAVIGQEANKRFGKTMRALVNEFGYYPVGSTVAAGTNIFISFIINYVGISQTSKKSVKFPTENLMLGLKQSYDKSSTKAAASTLMAKSKFSGKVNTIHADNTTGIAFTDALAAKSVNDIAQYLFLERSIRTNFNGFAASDEFNEYSRDQLGKLLVDIFFSKFSISKVTNSTSLNSTDINEIKDCLSSEFKLKTCNECQQLWTAISGIDVAVHTQKFDASGFLTKSGKIIMSKKEQVVGWFIYKLLSDGSTTAQQAYNQLLKETFPSNIADLIKQPNNIALKLDAKELFTLGASLLKYNYIQGATEIVKTIVEYQGK